MNKEDFILDIDPTPTFDGSTCRVLYYSILFFLKATPFIAALFIWHYFDMFLAIASFLVSFVIVGIIRSYIRNSSIPKKQQEYHYDDKAIVSWYIHRNFCF